MLSGLHNSMETLYLLSDARTRSISPENPTGEKGMGGRATKGGASYFTRDLGVGWKVSPFFIVEGGQTLKMADIRGSGAIQHIWITFSKSLDCWRDLILRFYWDEMENPAVEVPLGDFFCNGWNQYAQTSSLAVTVNPARGFNCYWTMPFKSRALITLENRNPEKVAVFYQIDYAEAEVPDDAAYFCACFRRSNPTKDAIHVILDGVRGKGQYVGTYLAWQVNNNNWWGEGEIKFYMDGDGEYPTICGTGTEDYFCGAYDFDVPGIGYTTYTTPYCGLNEVIKPDGRFIANTRFGMYRWHITDPIRFTDSLKVTIQDLGWRSARRYMKQQSDIASVAYWYQTLPVMPFEPLGDRSELEVI